MLYTWSQLKDEQRSDLTTQVLDPKPKGVQLQNCIGASALYFTVVIIINVLTTARLALLVLYLQSRCGKGRFRGPTNTCNNKVKYSTLYSLSSVLNRNNPLISD